MDPSHDDLIQGYLDGRVTADQEVELNAGLASDPDLARRFALAALLHDRLRDRFRTYGLGPGNGGHAVGPSAPRLPLPRVFGRRSVLAAGVIALLLGVLALVRGVGDRQASAAEVMLGRLIEAQDRVGDRTYRVVALDPGLAMTDDTPPRGRPQPTVDGALLHVRGEGQYVLVRRPEQLEEFITGSDGREAWSIPPDGPVRVSGDAARFRGALPGEQQGLPFLVQKSALGRLGEAYELSLIDGPDARLVARKRSAAHRGPSDVAIWFDPASGVIRRLRMDGLPRARGGPRSVVLELIEQRALGAAFFGHAAHHGPDRRVVHESP